MKARSVQPPLLKGDDVYVEILILTADVSCHYPCNGRVNPSNIDQGHGGDASAGH